MPTSEPTDRYRPTTVDRTLLADVALVTTLWCVSIAIVDPRGDFPLADDWSYGLTVKHLLESGDYRPQGGALAPMITNVLWGALFCLPTGFSFNALRVSTLVASLLGLIGCYVLLRDLQRPRWVAYLGVATLQFNPVYHALSFTFNTDVLFTALSIWAVVYLARSLRSGSHVQLLVGTALAVAATLSRQLALSIPLAFAIVVLLRSDSIRRSMPRALVSLIFCLGAFIALRLWLSSTGRALAVLDWRTNHLIEVLAHWSSLVRVLLGNAFASLVYLGLFLLPILLAFGRNVAGWRDKRTTALIVAGVVTIIAGAAVQLHHGYPVLMPMLADFLNRSGVGLLSMRKLDDLPRLPDTFWLTVTAMGVLGAILLITRLSSYAGSLLQTLGRKSIRNAEPVGMFLLLCGLIHLVPLLIVTPLFDRYLIPLVPVLAAGIIGMSGNVSVSAAHEVKPLSIRLAMSLLFISGLFSIVATHDYLAWNRVRWAALDNLTRNGSVSVREIDGGFEFNGLHAYDSGAESDFWDPVHPERSRWLEHGDTYLIAFGTVSGYSPIEEHAYRHWLPPHVQKVVVLRKD